MCVRACVRVREGERGEMGLCNLLSSWVCVLMWRRGGGLYSTVIFRRKWLKRSGRSTSVELLRGESSSPPSGKEFRRRWCPVWNTMLTQVHVVLLGRICLVGNPLIRLCVVPRRVLSLQFQAHECDVFTWNE